MSAWRSALSAPAARLRGQGARYILIGCASAAVYLLSTTLFALALGLPFEAALAAGSCVTVAFNFTAQRTFVWVHEGQFALSLHRQFGRYMYVVAAQYGVTALSVGVLPHLLGLASEIVYLATAASLAAVNFVAFRYGVFHAAGGGRARSELGGRRV
jgi:putative flippase GtrA